MREMSAEGGVDWRAARRLGCDGCISVAILSGVLLGLVSGAVCFVIRSFRDWPAAGVIGAASLGVAGVLTLIGSRLLVFSVIWALWTDTPQPTTEEDQVRGHDLWSLTSGILMIAAAIFWLVRSWR